MKTKQLLSIAMALSLTLSSQVYAGTVEDIAAQCGTKSLKNSRTLLRIGEIACGLGQVTGAVPLFILGSIASLLAISWTVPSSISSSVNDNMCDAEPAETATCIPVLWVGTAICWAPSFYLGYKAYRNFRGRASVEHQTLKDVQQEKMLDKADESTKLTDVSR